MSAFERVGEIETDDRRRATLGKIVEPSTRYFVERNDEGVIRLVPAVTITREEFNAAMKRAIAQAKKGKTVDVDDIDEFFKNHLAG